jgi:hypothetical protein
MQLAALPDIATKSTSCSSAQQFLAKTSLMGSRHMRIVKVTSQMPFKVTEEYKRAGWVRLNL